MGKFKSCSVLFPDGAGTSLCTRVDLHGDCNYSENNVISMVIAICLTMNIMSIVYGLINSAVRKMGIQNFQIYKYTITGKLSLLPMNPSGNECLAAFGVAIVFAVIMIAASSAVFKRGIFSGCIS